MITVIHTPFGQEHPYEQLPEERFPRQPLANEPFTIGIVTRPPGAVKEVVVHYRLENQTEQQLPARHLPQWQPELEEGVGAEFLERIIRIEQDVWNATLTAPPVGQTLTYWAVADGVQSDVFMLMGESWQVGGGASLADGKLTFLRSQTALPSDVATLEKVEWLGDGTQARRVRVTFKADRQEGFYGLGERFNALNQRGNVMDIRVYEQYKNQGKRTYMPVPFLLSSQGYGVWVQSSRWMQFDLASSRPDYWTLEADLNDDETLSLRWYKAPTPFEIVGQFTTETGGVTLPPEWSFGLWMSGNEWNSQARIEKEVKDSLAHGIQPSVIVIEAWSDETTFYIWNDAQYTPRAGHEALSYGDFTFAKEGKWTNPKAMVDWLHEQGVRVLLWQTPVVKQADHAHTQHDADRAHFEASGFGIRNLDGSLHRILPFWFRGGYIWDVTNAQEREWWFNKRAYLLSEVGIDGFKTDGGEHLWGEAVKFADGRTGKDVWNEYGQLYSEAYYQFANQHREAITFSRAGFTGSHRAPLHWAGDEHSTWEAFRHSIFAGLSAGISGISFWGWDFAGFSGDIPTAELYLRSTAMAVFCPVFQYHSEYNAHRQPSHDRTPWNIQERTDDERVLPQFLWWMHVREQLRPYIWQEAQWSASTGQPMMQAVQVSHSQADEFSYFFGRDLLVIPVVETQQTQRTFYLPEGQWRSLWSDDILEGERTITVDVPLNRIPVYVRAGASMPIITEASL